MLSITDHFVPNDDGWLLHLTQSVDPERFDEARRPLMIVPGYGMNGFIFGYHPKGTSMIAALAAAGHEVWTANLRAQGASRGDRRNPPRPSLRAYADVDLPAAVGGALARTDTSADRLTLIGCSLGGTIAYAYLALQPDHRASGVIAVGSPMRWNEIHPAFALAAKSPRLIGAVRMRGVRRLAGLAAPALAKIPGALSPYMNASHVDLSSLPKLVQTVEDPDSRVNRDIALWVNQRDLILRGVNVTQRLKAVDVPLLVVVSNRDGIVPDGAALSVLDAWGGTDVEVLRIGNDERWYAHADLFIGDHAPEDVFAPLAGWLATRRG